MGCKLCVDRGLQAAERQRTRELGPNGWMARLPINRHQENAQSDRKRLEALPVLTVVSKRIEAHRIATQCLVSHRFALHALHPDEADGARA